MPDTTSSQHFYALADRDAEPLFGRVVCGLDPTEASQEAARQAAALAGPGGRVVFVRVGLVPGDQPEYDAAIEGAIRVAEDLGADPTAELSDGHDPAAELLEHVGPGDLLVVGSHGYSQPQGILIGSVATSLLHRAKTAVLIARAAPSARPFPRELLVASDGSPESREAVGLAGSIARRHHARLTHLHAGSADADRRHALTEEAMWLEEATGSAPTVLMEDGSAHETIVARARERRCSLVLLGSRGLSGLSSLGSVSERVGHGAPCSVLVAHPPA
jgi:nucleotide-binding universal stress UspA family protein